MTPQQIGHLNYAPGGRLLMMAAGVQPLRGITARAFLP